MVITVQEAAVVCRQELRDCRHRTFAREAHWRAQQQDGGVFHFPAYDTARDWQGPKLGEFSAKADWPRSRWKGLVGRRNLVAVFWTSGQQPGDRLLFAT